LRVERRRYDGGGTVSWEVKEENEEEEEEEEEEE
jgi:hypothetical protein